MTGSESSGRMSGVYSCSRNADAGSWKADKQ
jgi:hypothetical protein